MSAAAAGRRPGNADTRGEIVEAAKRVFAAKGYDGASLRAVAREAGVDPALVHHYFDGKASLFVAAMALPFDPAEVAGHAPEAGVGGGSVGAGIVLGFLAMWDKAEGSGSSFASCVAAMATSTSVADAMREFVAERVWRGKPVQSDETEAMTLKRRTLVSSQLMGLALTRYILRMPPISTSTPAEIAQWAGPTLDDYLFGPPR